MTSGAPFPHLRRDLPPHCRFQIRTDPSWYDGRASTRLSQISVPHGSQTRKPESLNVTKTLRGNLVPADHLCCPTWQHFHFTTDLPQLTVFTPPFSRPGASRFSPHDRHTKPCLRSDWARREADPNRPPGLLPMRPIRTWPKPCMGDRLRGKSCSQRDHLPSLVAASTARNRNATARRSRRRCHGSCTHKAVTRAPRQLPRSQCISQFAHGPLLGHLERIDLKLRPSSCCRYGRRVSERPTCHPMWQQTHSPTTIPRPATTRMSG